MREEFRGPAFVGFHVRQAVADNAVIGLAKRGQRQGVARGPIEHEENFAVRSEQFPKGVAGFRGPAIRAIGEFVPGVYPLHRFEGFWTDPGIVIAGKLLWTQGPSIHGGYSLGSGWFDLKRFYHFRETF